MEAVKRSVHIVVRGKYRMSVAFRRNSNASLGAAFQKLKMQLQIGEDPDRITMCFKKDFIKSVGLKWTPRI